MSEPISPDAPPPVPASIIGAYGYCPRLAVLQWVHGHRQEVPAMIAGLRAHRRFDRWSETTAISLGDEAEGLTARLDFLISDADGAVPVEYKVGADPGPRRAVRDAEALQVTAQAMLLRAAGHPCAEGRIVYLRSNRTRAVPITDEAIAGVRAAVVQLRRWAESGDLPPPLVDSPRCPPCSLLPVCLPGELANLTGQAPQPRPLSVGYPGLPLYVQEPGARIGRRGDTLVIRTPDGAESEHGLVGLSHVAVFGRVQVTTDAVQTLSRRGLPLSFFGSDGWYFGTLAGLPHRHVELRLQQYLAAFDPAHCLRLARRFVAAKLRNGYTLIRRSHRGQSDDALAVLSQCAALACEAPDLPRLLAIEGRGAQAYFRAFAAMLRPPHDMTGTFDWQGRNRRPPRDPVNALLSFSYAMLAREWAVHLHIVGFDPYLGFYHQPRYGRPALALDVMEEFRPIIADSVVLGLINRGEVTAEDFRITPGAVELRRRARKALIMAFERRLAVTVRHPLFREPVSYRRLFEVQARLLARHLGGETADYPTFTVR